MDNTSDTFIELLGDEVNKLGNKIDGKIINIEQTDTKIPESEDIDIENHENSSKHNVREIIDQVKSENDRDLTCEVSNIQVRIRLYNYSI